MESLTNTRSTDFKIKILLIRKSSLMIIAMHRDNASHLSCLLAFVCLCIKTNMYKPKPGSVSSQFIFTWYTFRVFLNITMTYDMCQKVFIYVCARGREKKMIVVLWFFVRCRLTINQGFSKIICDFLWWNFIVISAYKNCKIIKIFFKFNVSRKPRPIIHTICSLFKRFSKLAFRNFLVEHSVNSHKL